MGHPKRPASGKPDPATESHATPATPSGATTPSGAPATPSSAITSPPPDVLASLQAAHEALRASHAALQGERDGLADQLTREQQFNASLQAERDTLVGRLREAEAERAHAGSLRDGLRALGQAAGLDHLPGPREVLDALRSRVDALKGRPGSGFTGVKRFQGHGTFLGKGGRVVTLAPGDAVPDDVDLAAVDPRLITAE